MKKIILFVFLSGARIMHAQVFQPGDFVLNAGNGAHSDWVYFIDLENRVPTNLLIQTKQINLRL